MKTFISMTIKGALCLALGLSVSVAQADKQDDEIAKVRAELAKMIPSATTAEIKATPAESVYRLSLGGNFAYAYVSGDFVLIGDLYNTVNQENLGEIAQAEFLNTFEEKMIVFGAKDAKRYMTVFTDIDCGYCRKLHQEVAALNQAGVKVRYVAFPRAGVGSESYNKYVSVWCNEDKQKALTDAKAGRAVASATCDNPISDSYDLGRQFGVSGTPTIVFDNGGRAPGYMPAEQLLLRMGVSEEGAE